MTRFVLLRHAVHDWLGRGLAGRMDGVPLNARGREQAQQLVLVLAKHAFDAVVSSPQQRARETVGPFARHAGLAVGVDAAFDEVDYGDWTGWTFERLERDAPEAWRHWCERRAGARPPGGEPFADVPRRALAGMQRQQQLWPQGTVLVASHGVVIRALLAAHAVSR